jgi:glycine cleavage system T protein
MAQHSPLDDLHRTLGATFQEEAGRTLPAHYGDPVQEHRAVREAAGLIHLAFRTTIRVTGTDRTRFLNGTLTNDIARLTPGTGCYACLLNPQGKIVADAEAHALRDGHLLEVDAPWKERILDHLNKYLIAEDVTFQEMEGDAVLALQGPRAPLLLQRLFPGTTLPAVRYHAVEVAAEGQNRRVIRASVTGEEGYKLYLPAEGAVALWKRLTEAGAAPVGMAALETLRLEAGNPVFGVDFTESHFPQEAGIEEKAVSFTKGCYIGQEFVIRIAHRGHVNRRIAGLIARHEPIPHPGDRVLRDEKEVGRISSAALSPTLGKIIALGMLRRECLEPGTPVHVENQGGRIAAQVVPLPFYEHRGD